MDSPPTARLRRRRRCELEDDKNNDSKVSFRSAAEDSDTEEQQHPSQAPQLCIGKRARLPGDEDETPAHHESPPSPKVARRPQHHDGDDGDDDAEDDDGRPLASSLAAYLDHRRRFRPRPEWLLDIPTTTTTESNGNGGDHQSSHRLVSMLVMAKASRRRNQLYQLYAPHFRILEASRLIHNQSVDDDSSTAIHNDSIIADNNDDADDQDDDSNHSDSDAPSSDAAAAPVDVPLEAIEQRLLNPKTTESNHPKPVFFGKDWNSALMVAIRRDAVREIIQELIQRGAPVNALNAQGVSPLIMAAQKGRLELVQDLLAAGADLRVLSHSGVSSVMQAAHFGHAAIVEYLLSAPGGNALVEAANHNETTPLMRASQEGHASVVEVLLQWGAQVNRRNQTRLSPLMLAAQRGHAAVVRQLVRAGADVDAVTAQSSSALMLAVKRNHRSVVLELVRAGGELGIRDIRGRNARQLAGHQARTQPLRQLLDPPVQVELMQQQARGLRSWEMIRMWHLLQKDRARPVSDEAVDDFDDWETNFRSTGHNQSSHETTTTATPEPTAWTVERSSKRMLVHALHSLPAPLVGMIAQYLPYPHLWDLRIGMLTKRAAVDSNMAVLSAMDLMDEILEEGGFAEACDAAGLPPPPNLPREFPCWRAWKAFGRQHGVAATAIAAEEEEINLGPMGAASAATPRPNITLHQLTPPHERFNDSASVVSTTEYRRYANFLQTLAKSDALVQVLTVPPYNMPPGIVQQLVTCSDAVSVARRMTTGGVSFDTHVAMDFIMLISRLCSWYWCYYQGTPSTNTNTTTASGSLLMKMNK